MNIISRENNPKDPNSFSSKEGRTGVFLMMHDQLVLFPVTHEFTKLFFVICDQKVLRDP